MYDVFLSHNRRQKPWVRLFYRFLIKQGLQVFFDEASIAPGEDIQEAIERGIEQSRHVVLILSPESLQSRWVAKEAGLSLYNETDSAPGQVVPVILEEVDLKKVRLGVRALNIVDLCEPELREERLRSLIKHLGVQNADQIPEPELRQLLQTMDSVASMQLHVANLNDVVKWKWNGPTLLEKLIDLDYITITDLDDLNEGDKDQWGPVFMYHPQTFRLLTTEPQNIVGYWHIAALFPPEYELAKDGKLLDSQITAGTVQELSEPGHYDVYFVQVCLLPQYCWPSQRLQLFNTFFEVLDELAEAGIFVREICANAFTDVGRSLCRRFYMEPTCKHMQRGTIFVGPISAVLKRSTAQRFPELHRRYAEQGLIEAATKSL